MKHVFNSGEIPHLWAHQTQSDARNGQGSLYFDGDTIFSYGSHFPMARHVTNSRGEKGILLTTRSYSVTTSKHLGMVRRAIPRDIPCFSVEYPDHAPEKIFKAFSEDIAKRSKELLAAHPRNAFVPKRKLQKQTITLYAKDADGNAFSVDALTGKYLAMHPSISVSWDRKSFTLTKDYTLTHIKTGLSIDRHLAKVEARYMLESLDSIKLWSQVTGNSDRELLSKLSEKCAKARTNARRYDANRHPSTIAKQLRELETAVIQANDFAEFFGYRKRFALDARFDFARTIAETYETAANERRGRNEAIRYARNERNEAIRYARNERERELSRKPFSERLAAWLNGETSYLGVGPDGSAYLRINSANEVLTSMGARVPLSHVVRAIPVVKALITNGRTYQANGHTIHLGYYSLDRIDESGNVYAGCHTFKRSEVDRFIGVIESMPKVTIPETPETETTTPEQTPEQTPELSE